MTDAKMILLHRLKDLEEEDKAPITVKEVRMLLTQIEDLRIKACRANEMLGKSESQLYSCHQLNRNLQKSIKGAISNFKQDDHLQGIKILEITLEVYATSQSVDF